MRLYSHCLQRRVLCVTSPASQSCKQYVRHNRSYELSFSAENISRLHKLERELSAQILEAHARKLRLEKQHQIILAKLRATGDRET
jgi:hypothetical protein